MQRVAHLYHFQDAGIAICISGAQDYGLFNGDFKLAAPCYVPQGLGGADALNGCKFPPLASFLAPAHIPDLCRLLPPNLCLQWMHAIYELAPMSCQATQTCETCWIWELQRTLRLGRKWQALRLGYHQAHLLNSKLSWQESVGHCQRRTQACLAADDGWKECHQGQHQQSQACCQLEEKFQDALRQRRTRGLHCVVLRCCIATEGDVALLAWLALEARVP